MKKTSKVLFFALLLLPIFGYCESQPTEQEEFQTVCKLYQDTVGTTGVLNQAQDFLKRYSTPEYVTKVQYIMADANGDSDEAIGLFQKVASKEKGSELSISALVMMAQIQYNLGRYKESADAFQKIADVYPTNFLVREALYNLAQAQIAMGEWNKAENTLRKLVAIDPYYEKQEKVVYTNGIILYHQNNYDAAYQKFSTLNSPEALFYQGKCQEKLQKYIPATVTYKQLLTQYPKTGFAEEVRFLIGDCFFRSGDYTTALEEFNKFTEDFPTSYLKENALFRIGCCYYLKKDYGEGISKFRNFLSDYPKSEFSAEVNFIMGESFLAQKDLIRAAFAYGEILKNFPTSTVIPQTYYKLGWCYTLQDSYESALEMFNTLLTNYPKSPLVPYALLLSADNYTKKGNLDQAIECYRKILDMPDKTEEMTEAALFMMTKTFYNAKRYNDIISSFQYIINSLPPSSSEWRSYTYLMVAESYYATGFFTESTRIYDMVIKNFPYTQVASMAQEGKAWSAFKVKDYSKAQKDREEFTEDMTVQKGKNTEISNEFEMGNIYFNQKKYVEALDAFEKFVQDFPDDEQVPDAIFNSGRCYYKLEYYSKAIAAWEKLINNYPKYSHTQEAMNMAADTYFRAQKYPEAIAAYKKLLSAYPGTDVAKQAQLRIAQSHFNAMDNEGAIAEFQIFLNSYPDDSSADNAIDGITMSADRMNQSGHPTELDIKVFKDFVAKFPKSKVAGDAQFKLAMRYYEKKNYPKAAEEFKSVADYSAAPQNVQDSLYYGAEAYYYGVNYVDAIPIYRRFIKNFPKHEQIRIGYLHLANSLFYTEKYLDAAQVYSDLTRLTKDKDDISSTALLNTALCYKKAQKWQETANTYERYLEEYPKSENLVNTLVELFGLYEILKQYDNAIAVAEELLDKIPKNDPLRPELMYKIGELDLKQNNAKTGIEELRQLLNYRPINDPWRLSAVARVAQEYENAKQWDDAVIMYREVINSTKDPKWVAAAKERMQAIAELRKQQ